MHQCVCVFFHSYGCLPVHYLFQGWISNVVQYLYGWALVRRAQAAEKLAWAHYLQPSTNKASFAYQNVQVYFSLKAWRLQNHYLFGSRIPPGFTFLPMVHKDADYYKAQKWVMHTLNWRKKEQRDFRHHSDNSEVKYICMSLWHLIFKEYAEVPLARFFFPFVRQTTPHWMKSMLCNDLYTYFKRLWHHLGYVSFKDIITGTITLTLHLDKLRFGSISSLLPH